MTSRMVSSIYLNRRFRILGIVLVCVAIVYFFFLGDLNAYYLRSSPSGNNNSRDDPQVAAVVASVRDSDTKWLSQHFPDWDVKVYVTDDEPARLKIPKNKGREAMVYLTYMIDHYDDYRDDAVIIFLHADRQQWHNDDENHDGVSMLQRLKTAHIVKEGYVNLRCHRFPGCTPGLDLSKKPTGNDSESVTVASFFYSSATLFPNSTPPSRIAVGCCAQFGVTAGTIRANPKERYEELRKWLLETPLSDYLSGRVMEYTWHMLLGKPAVHCPEPQQCYCEVYGRCDLKCDNGDCGVYKYPFGVGYSFLNKIKDFFDM